MTAFRDYLACSLLCVVVASTVVADHRIASGGTITELDGTWTASNDDHFAINATVPGDLITDLQFAGAVGDPLYELNFLRDSEAWAKHNWTFSRDFSVSNAVRDGSAAQLLVFDGIKMGANIYVNGKLIGTAEDQFLRYVFPLENLSGPEATVEVMFPVLMDIDGRWMACSGGWDWAPYTNTSMFQERSNHSQKTFSKGIWKSVYLIEVPLGTVAITHLTPHTIYQGAYPVGTMIEGGHGDFRVNCTVHVWAPLGGASGTLAVTGSWGVEANKELTVPEGSSSMSVQLVATAEQIRLWWPNGMGEQSMYNVTASWSSGAGQSTTSRRIGFRVFAFVTSNDTDPAYVEANKDADGTVMHGLFFRVNGAAMYARGANMIPMDELEGRLDGVAHRYVVKSSADARMNTLRVWGGGMFLPREFYEACDDYGILVYHDMQYAGALPKATTTQDQELRHQIRRLSHHPSIALWDGCNECVVNPGQDSEIYATFVMTVVAQEDQMRVIMPSSPSSGWVTGVNRLFGIANGNPLTTRGGGAAYSQGNEGHAPYQLGSGFPAKNSGWDYKAMDDPDRGAGIHMPLEDLQPDTYFWTQQGIDNYCCVDAHHRVPQPGDEVSGHEVYKIEAHGGQLPSLAELGDLVMRETAFGVQYPNGFYSEFGATTMSSFESMSGTLAPEHWGIHGGSMPDNCTGHPQAEYVCTGDNVMAQRNYACDATIVKVFGEDTLVDKDATGEHVFKGQLYQCMIAQAIIMKENIEMHRTQNHYGTLTWQLNEIWPTGGWGSLEYGNVGLTPGQVLGGRWKPLHYWLKASIYADVMSTCGLKRFPKNTKDWVCFARNDKAGLPFAGSVTLNAYDLMGSGSPRELVKSDLSLDAGPGAMHWFSPPSNRMPNANTTAVISTVRDSAGMVISEHMVQLDYPRFLRVPLATLSTTLAETQDAAGTVNITVSSDKVALFVTLTTRAQGRFSDNSFFLPATSKVIQFLPHGNAMSANELDLLKSSLRVEDHSMYAGAYSSPGPLRAAEAWVV